jgi:hypothetical protein
MGDGDRSVWIGQEYAMNRTIRILWAANAGSGRVG